MPADPQRRWWGRSALPDPAGRIWQIGPLTLHLRRLGGALHVGQLRGDDPLEERVSAGACSADEPIPEGAIVDRLLVSADVVSLELEPAAADRPMIVRPETRVTLPAGADLLAWVSTPLWLRLRAGDSELEIPLSRPSDTWFGASTREGELAYAGRTLLRLKGDALPNRPHRAFTPVTVHNRSGAPLILDRLRIPTQRLGLYATADGALWTQSLELEASGEVGLARNTILPGPPRERPDAQPVVGARSAPEDALVLRTFSSVVTTLLG